MLETAEKTAYLIPAGQLVEVLKPNARRWIEHRMSKPVKAIGREVLDGNAIYSHDGFKIRVPVRGSEFE